MPVAVYAIVAPILLFPLVKRLLPKKEGGTRRLFPVEDDTPSRVRSAAPGSTRVPASTGRKLCGGRGAPRNYRRAS
jgi:hypothetical protein